MWGLNTGKSMEEHIPAAIMCRKRHLNLWRTRHWTALSGYGWPPCTVCVQSETAQITLPATFEQLESARQLLGVESLNMAKIVRAEALRPYLEKCLPLQGMDLGLEQLRVGGKYPDNGSGGRRSLDGIRCGVPSEPALRGAESTLPGDLRKDTIWKKRKVRDGTLAGQMKPT